MGSDSDVATSPRSFRIHGGRCTLSLSVDEIRIRQTFLRHHHLLGWLLTILSLLFGGYSLLTGWKYTAGTGVLVGWEFFLPVAGYLLVIPAVRRAIDWYNGYTNATTIPLSAVEAVTLTTADIRWYFKTQKTVPVCLIRYRSDGERNRRRFKLKLRSGTEEVQDVVDAFEECGLRVRTDRSASEFLASTEV
jgi:hypothetical protein